MSQAELKTYTWEEIAKHDKDDDCWVVMYDKVLDVSDWLHQHPGGLDPIKDMAGTDITSSFESIGHTSTAVVRSKAMIIGRLDPKSVKTVKPVEAAPVKKWSDMTKEERRQYKSGGEIIPLWVIAAVVFVVLALIYMLW